MAAPPGFNGRTEMFKDEVTAVGNAAKGKINLLEHNFTGYIMMSLLAGLYIALGSILMGIVGGVFTGGGSYATKLACGIVFSVGLCFVTMGGAELFTGNNLVMTIGGLKKTVTWGQVAKLWIVCWLGNLVRICHRGSDFHDDRHSGKWRYRSIFCEYSSCEDGRIGGEPVFQSDSL